MDASDTSEEYFSFLEDLIGEEENTDDLSKVKLLSHKLQLSTKRKSVLQWRSVVEEKKRNGLLGSAESNNDFPTSKRNDSSNNDVIAECVTLDENKNPILLIPNAPKADEKLITTSKNLTSENKEHMSPSTHTSLKNKNVKEKREKNIDSERRRKITEALTSIRKDLILMRMEDHSLSRKLLNIRESLNRQRAALSCDEHAKMLDIITWEIEAEKELNEMHKVSDLSGALLRHPDSVLRSPTVLHQMGINRVTFDFRRFSVI